MSAEDHKASIPGYLYDDRGRRVREMTSERPIVLVCGSRSWTDRDAIRRRLSGLDVLFIVLQGGARGADRLAGEVASELGLESREMRADWDTYGRDAGKIRNRAMLDLKPKLVIAFWDGHSGGTAHTVTEAVRRHIPVEVIVP